jgi:energy-coupling factor transporter ATP-binding protein EcfA2
MITSLEHRNFKAHRETTLPLGQLTVLVGPNSAGKTSVLQALAVLGASVGEDPWVSLSRLGTIEDLVSRQANDTYLELAVTLQDSTMGKGVVRSLLPGACAPRAGRRARAISLRICQILRRYWRHATPSECSQHWRRETESKPDSLVPSSSQVAAASFGWRIATCYRPSTDPVKWAAPPSPPKNMK